MWESSIPLYLNQLNCRTYTEPIHVCIDDVFLCKFQEQVPPQKTKISKKLRKMQELEQKLRDTEFDRAFRMEFWPDNV